MAWIEANGIRIWCERAGTGSPLLVITGTGGDLRKAPNILASPLAKRFETVAYDQRGLGQTDKPDGPYSMADYAADAIGVMDALGWSAAHVVGISFGGMVAQEVAIRRPDRVSRLVLCCTSPGGEGGASYPLHELQDLEPEARARRMVAISDTRNDDAWAAAHPERHAMLVAMAMNEPYAHEPRFALGRRLQLEARSRHDTWDRLGDIRAPTLISAGRYDGLALPETQSRMATRIPDATLKFYEGGHLYLMQDPQGFADIAAFLDA